MHLKLSGKTILANNVGTRALPGIFVDFNSGPKLPFPELILALSSLGGLFHQGQFPYCSGYEARRVQHFPDFNLESFFIIKNIFIMKNLTDFGETVETGVHPCLPNCPLGESPTTWANVRLNAGAWFCRSRTFLLRTSSNRYRSIHCVCDWRHRKIWIWSMLNMNCLGCRQRSLPLPDLSRKIKGDSVRRVFWKRLFTSAKITLTTNNAFWLVESRDAHHLTPSQHSPWLSIFWTPWWL